MLPTKAQCISRQLLVWAFEEYSRLTVACCRVPNPLVFFICPMAYLSWDVCRVDPNSWFWANKSWCDCSANIFSTTVLSGWTLHGSLSFAWQFALRSSRAGNFSLSLSNIFHKVVYQCFYGVVGSLIITLLQTLWSVCQWKNFERGAKQ